MKFIRLSITKYVQFRNTGKDLDTFVGKIIFGFMNFSKIFTATA